VADKFQISEIKIIDSREGSSPASTWSEDLCLKRVSQTHFQLFVGGYEVVGETSEFFDEETGEEEIPDEIGGYPVQGIEDGYVIGGEIVKNEEYGEFQFSDFKAADVRDWLASVNWEHAALLQEIADIVSDV
jgi:hypothetical protein